MYSQRLIHYKKNEESDPNYLNYNMNIDFVIHFETEQAKDELGNTLKELMKEREDDEEEDPQFCEQYEEIELKFKIGKILESKSRLGFN